MHTSDATRLKTLHNVRPMLGRHPVSDQGNTPSEMIVGIVNSPDRCIRIKRLLIGCEVQATQTTALIEAH
jgi:hypothetical protein